MDDLDLGATIRGFSPGQKAFNRYTLRKILGRGGMGVVWLARDEELEIDVALKFLPEIVAMDKESVGELKRETRRNLGLTHPHIVRVYDFVQGPTTAAISMEYVDGASLATLKLEQPGHVFAPEQLLPWTEQLCSALDYAHRSVKIVHRDLKPANLMINAQGELKITDFGIARSVADSVSRVSKQAGSSGTPLYMSPQQMMGDDPAVPDDIYSLGATLYELLTGKPPFHTGNIIAQVQGKVPEPVNTRRASLGVSAAPVPAVWEEVLAAALAKERADRPQGVKEFMQRLAGTSAPKPAPAAVAKPAAPVEVKSSAVRYDAGGPKAASKGNRSAGLFSGVALGVLLLVGLGYYFGIHAPEQQRIAAEQARQAEAARQAEQQRQAEEARRAALAAEQARQAEVRKQAELAERARQTEAARVADEQRRAEEARRAAQAAEQTRLAEGKRQMELAERTRQAEAARIAAEQRKLDDAKREAAVDKRAWTETWIQYAESNGQWKELARFQLARDQFGRFSMSPLAISSGVALGSTGLTEVSFNDLIWKFKFDWKDQGTAEFILQKKSDGVYEGYSYLGGRRVDRNRWTREGTEVSGAVTGLTTAGTAPANVIDLAEARHRGELPVARVQTAPQFPDGMRRAGISGSVSVQFIINTTGDVVYGEVTRSSHREFESAALNAVMKWKFRPARIDGRAVNVRVQQQIDFNLEDARKSP